MRYRYPVRHLLTYAYRFLAGVTLSVSLQGCGLLYDAVELVHPLTRDELSLICARGRLHVGISVEPFRPFVFPAIYTDEGVRVTGLDVELIREIADALTRVCGDQKPIVPMLHLTRFPNLFIEMNEGHLDLFVSSTGGTVPGAKPSGLWFSAPYFPDDGLALITSKPEVAEKIQAVLHQQAAHHDTLQAMQTALRGLTVGAQKGRPSELYAQANLHGSRIVICDSLPVAVETQEPGLDVILSNHSILEYVTKRVWHEWRLITRKDGSPLLLTRDSLSIVTNEESRRLQWFLNNLIYRLEESGRLRSIRKRWIEDEYAPTRRATTEGLPFEISKVPAHYDQGQCRSDEARGKRGR
jgi:polar amino acid transport system substrate-binding protein